MGRQSSAYGYSQALDGTWEEYQEDQRRGARRDRIDDATDFMGWYMDQSTESALASRNGTRRRSIWPITKGAPAMRGKAIWASRG
jgi:hypothetical protein